MKLVPTFDLPNARACLAASEAAYCAPSAHDCPSRNTQIAAAAGWVTCLETSLAHCSLCRNDGLLILAFRGSRDVRDWLTDFDALQAPASETPWGRMRVHRGFWLAIQSIKDQLLALDSRAQKEGVFVTGHSLGGALALLAAQILFNALVPVIAVYTFGGPRVGNRAWAENYNLILGGRTFRFVNQEDVIPRVPFLGYHHVGHQLLMTSGGHLLTDPPLWRTLASDAVGLGRAWRARRLAAAPLIECLEDHPLSAYQRSLEACLVPGATLLTGS